MKAKLIKTDDGYNLVTQGFLKASTEINLINQMNIEEGNIRYYLSKQNCNSLFGVVDVEKLKSDYVATQLKGLDKVDYEKYLSFAESDSKIFEEGFNKAMELNRFTLDDIRKAYYVGYEDGKSGATFFQQLIQSLQQPTEIEVMIVMEEILQLKKRAGGFTNMGKPKLDSDGQLILKKI